RGEGCKLHERLRALSFYVLTRVISGLDDRRTREDVALAFDRLMRASTPPSRRQLLYRLSGRSPWDAFWTAKAEAERLLAEQIAAVLARDGHSDGVGDGDGHASILDLLAAA